VFQLQLIDVRVTAVGKEIIEGHGSLHW